MKMVSLEKQSKKAQREFYKLKRKQWQINPVTRKSKNSHEYKQRKAEMRGV